MLLSVGGFSARQVRLGVQGDKGVRKLLGLCYVLFGPAAVDAYSSP